MKKVVFPGEQIAVCSSSLDLGTGTYIAANNVYASIAGFLTVDGNRVSVSRCSSQRSTSMSTVPTINCIVLAKVVVAMLVLHE